MDTGGLRAWVEGGGGEGGLGVVFRGWARFVLAGGGVLGGGGVLVGWG